MFTSMRSRRIPALLTSVSIPPKVSTAWLTSRRAPSQSDASSPLATACPPMARISSTTSWAGPLEVPPPSGAVPRSLTTTRAPWRANSSAWLLPIPRPAPVITTTLPSQIPLIEPPSSGPTGRSSPFIRVVQPSSIPASDHDTESRRYSEGVSALFSDVRSGSKPTGWRTPAAALRANRKPSSVVHELSAAAASVHSASKCHVMSDSFRRLLESTPINHESLARNVRSARAHKKSDRIGDVLRFADTAEWKAIIEVVNVVDLHRRLDQPPAHVGVR